jgi:hypothetical protein
MKQLILHTNAISGSLPASYAQWHLQLCVLDLSSNRLSSTLPPQWGSIVSPLFSFISLRNNKLSGTLPSAWSRLRHISQLYLDTNRLSGSIPASSGGGDLQVVTLQNNSLTGTIPSSLTNGSNICILLLNDNRLRGRLPPLSPSLFRPKCTIYSGYQVSSQFRPAILVHNNRLSCSLPGAPLALGASRHHYVGANECGNNSYPRVSDLSF